jgi:hypothetical protein
VLDAARLLCRRVPVDVSHSDLVTRLVLLLERMALQSSYNKEKVGF